MIDEKVLMESLEAEETRRFLKGLAPLTLLSVERIIRKQLNVMEWIPVSVRLPKQNERIIGTFKNDKGKTVVCEETFYPHMLKGLWPIVAWMPLPSPWKGEEE